MTPEELKAFNELNETIKSLKNDKENCERILNLHKDKAYRGNISINAGSKSVIISPNLWDTADTISNYIDELASEIQHLEEKFDNYKIFVPGTLEIRPS